MPSPFVLGCIYAVMVLLASLSPRYSRALVAGVTVLWIVGLLAARFWFPVAPGEG